MITHTLYRMYNHSNELLYIGITLDVAQRFGVHRANKSWWPEVATITLEHHATRLQLETAEATAITNEQPLYNVKRRTRSETARESARRLRQLNDDQRHWFKQIRYIAHRPPTNRQLRNAIQRAVDSRLSTEDIRWALDHPRTAIAAVQEVGRG